MKPTQLLLTIVFAVAALAVAAWIGRPSKNAILKPLASVPEETNELPISKTGPHPKAVAERLAFNFGAVELGATGEHKFTIKNEGEAPLRVKTGKTSCGQCTFGDVSRTDDIPPGETVDVVVKYNIKSPNPQFRQWAEVFTNDPKNKRFEFAIEGRVENTIVLSPSLEWVVGDLSETEPKVVRGTLSSKIIDTITIDKVECSKKDIDVKWETVPATEERAKEFKSLVDIIVTIPPGQPIGPYREKVTLHLPHKEGTKIDFGLSGLQPSPFDIKGLGWNPATSTLVLPEFPASQGRKAKLTIYVRDFDEDLTMEVVSQKYNSVKITPSKGRVIGKARMYDIEIEVLPNQPLSIRRGENAEQIDLKLNHPKASEFKLLVSYQTT